MDKIRILIASSSPGHSKDLADILIKEQDFLMVGEAADGPAAIKKAEHLLPDIVIMDTSLPVRDGFGTAAAITLAHPNIGVILMDEREDSNTVKQAMMAGARDFIPWENLKAEELSQSVRRLYQESKARAASLHTIKSDAREQNVKSPQVVTIYGAKGGTGKTTLTVNMAVAIARAAKRRVVIIDLNLQFGDVAVYMDAKPRRTIAELVQERNQWDGPLVNSYLIEHSSGVKILPAPLRPEDAELVSADHVEKIIAILRESYDFIIIDSSPYMSDALLSALDTSNQIIFLMTMDLPAVKNAKLGLRLLTGLNHSGKTKLVINRGSKQFGIDLKDIEKTIDFLAAAEIPSEGNTVVNAANKGIPFIISSPQSAVSKAVENVARMVVEDTGYQSDLKVKQERGSQGIFKKKLFR